MAPISDPSPVRAFLDDRHLALAADLDAWCLRELAPLPAPMDDAAGRDQAREILIRLGRDGWLARALGDPAGGSAAEPDLRACVLVRETLASHSPLADAVFALQALGSLPIRLAHAAPPEADWAARAVTGEAMAAFAMTEPEAGSDVAAMTTTARRERDGYVLDGRKTLISNAGIADFYTVFASTGGEPGHRGISCFVVPATTPGLRFVKPLVLAAPHPLGEIAFESCRVPVSARLGEEGRGFKLGMATLDRLRPTVAAAACGMAGRALAEATAYAARRVQFGKPIAEFQTVQQKLARMATDLTAARLLVYRAAWEKDRGAERITLESAMAKAFATEAAQRIVDDAVQILGGIGVLAGNPVERLYSAVRPLRIYEGTTEILNLVIAGHLLKGPAGRA